MTTMIQGNLSDNYYCYECLSPIDNSMKYIIISPRLLEESGDVLCDSCYTPELLTQLQEQE